MKYFILIWAGLWRKKTRTIFTMLSVMVAFLLFGLLQGVNIGFETALDNLDARRLYTTNKYSMVEGMRLSVGNRIATVPGVTGVTHLTFFGGYYQDRRNAIPALAADVQALLDVYGDTIEISDEAREKMRRTRNGAILYQELADQYGWKVGDVVPIGTSIWTKKDGRTDYQFEIVGIYKADGMNQFFINYDYFDEARALGNGMVHYYIVGVDDPRNGTEIGKKIDDLFANSSEETKTQTEQAFAASQINQLADINFIVNAIVGAVLFTLLFVTGNTMMQSMRERIPELAILKSMGFSDLKVSVFVLCESALLCVFSALIGLAIARVLFTLLVSALGNVDMPINVILLGIVTAFGLALVSGAPPAWRARQLKIVDALAAQ